MCVYASIVDLYETFRTNQSLSASLNCKNWMQSEDNSKWTEFLCQSLSCSMWFKRAGANSLKCLLMDSYHTKLMQKQFCNNTTLVYTS